MIKAYSNKILFFDGDCILCNSLVDFIIRADKKNQIQFASLQGQTAQKLIKQHTSNLDTIVFLIDGKVLTKANAVFSLFDTLGGIYAVFKTFKVFPNVIRDWVYDQIAQRRYNTFGKRTECRLPTPEDKHKILP